MCVPSCDIGSCAAAPPSTKTRPFCCYGSAERRAAMRFSKHLYWGVLRSAASLPMRHCGTSGAAVADRRTMKSVPPRGEGTGFMIEAKKFCDELRRRGFSFFTGVPCSVFKSTINHISTRSDLTYVTAANEGGALAIAAGAWLAGRKLVVILQISGVGKLINPLSSLSLAYDPPPLLLISARRYPDGPGDEPQHRIMGRSLSKILDALGVYNLDLPP